MSRVEAGRTVEPWSQGTPVMIYYKFTMMVIMMMIMVMMREMMMRGMMTMVTMITMMMIMMSKDVQKRH